MFFQERSRSHLKAPAGVKRWESPPLQPQIRLRIWVEVYLKNTRLLVRGRPLQWSAHNPGPCGPVLVLDATCTSAAYWGAPHRSALYSCYAPFGNKWATPDKSSYTSLGWFNRSNLGTDHTVMWHDNNFCRSDRLHASLNVDCTE